MLRLSILVSTPNVKLVQHLLGAVPTESAHSLSAPSALISLTSSCSIASLCLSLPPHDYSVVTQGGVDEANCANCAAAAAIW